MREGKVLPGPDFKKVTIETVAKRAAFRCSNPDCRVVTVGPNSDDQKSTTIGEAAHIFGARPSSCRYDNEMTDTARASITNAIWLCRNCHKKIDTDGNRYSADVLFAWREQHEEFSLSQLGNATDKIRFEQMRSVASQFEDYPALVRRIVIDEPPGWEWRLTAELLRHLNEPLFRKIRDLRQGLYVRPLTHLTADEVPAWINNYLAEMSSLVQPLTGLLEQLNRSWGQPGQGGDLDEIHHICRLLHDHLEQVVEFEERVQFTHVPEEYAGVISNLKGVVGTQVEKLSEIPSTLDEVVSLVDAGFEGDRRIEKTIVFDLPPGWVKRMKRELRKANQKQFPADRSCLGCLFALALLLLLLFIIF